MDFRRDDWWITFVFETNGHLVEPVAMSFRRAKDSTATLKPSELQRLRPAKLLLRAQAHVVWMNTLNHPGLDDDERRRAAVQAIKAKRAPRAIGRPRDEAMHLETALAYLEIQQMPNIGSLYAEMGVRLGTEECPIAEATLKSRINRCVDTGYLEPGVNGRRGRLPGPKLRER